MIRPFTLPVSIGQRFPAVFDRRRRLRLRGGDPPWERMKLQGGSSSRSSAEIATATSAAERGGSGRGSDDRRLNARDEALARRFAADILPPARVPADWRATSTHYAVFAELATARRSARPGIAVGNASGRDHRVSLPLAESKSSFGWRPRTRVFSLMLRLFSFAFSTPSKLQPPADFVFYVHDLETGTWNQHISLSSDDVRADEIRVRSFTRPDTGLRSHLPPCFRLDRHESTWATGNHKRSVQGNVPSNVDAELFREPETLKAEVSTKGTAGSRKTDVPAVI
jgi:hypothetical protein